MSSEKNTDKLVSFVLQNVSLHKSMYDECHGLARTENQVARTSLGQ